MMKLTGSTRIWFFNDKLGYAGYNELKHLIHTHITEEILAELTERGYHELKDLEPYDHIKMYVVMKEIPKDKRHLFCDLRDTQGYEKVKKYLDDKQRNKHN